MAPRPNRLEDRRISEDETHFIDNRHVNDLFQRASEFCGEPFRREGWRQSLVGESPQIQQVVEIIRLVAARRATVLITGESGTGKEVAARALHLASPRCYASWVAVIAAPCRKP